MTTARIGPSSSGPRHAKCPMSTSSFQLQSVIWFPRIYTEFGVSRETGILGAGEGQRALQVLFLVSPRKYASVSLSPPYELNIDAPPAELIG